MRSTIAIATVLLALTLTTAASAAVPGLNLVVASSGPPDSNASHTATAECPEGRALLGLGGRTEGGGGQVVLDALAARTNHNATVRGHEDQDGTGANWAVKAYAICADDGGERRTTFNEEPNSLSPKFATTASCAATSRRRNATSRPP